MEGDLFNLIFEEISLEGFDGITLATLWNRLMVNKKFVMPLDSLSKGYIWNILKHANHLTFYQLPTPRDTIPLNLLKMENYESVNELRLLLAKMHPSKVKDCKSASSMDYKYDESTIEIDRKNVTSIIRNLDYDQVERDFGNCLVLVSSLSRRIATIFGKDVAFDVDLLTPFHYEVMEKAARSRSAGLTTNSKDGLRAILPESKIMYHILKKLMGKKYLVRVASVKNSAGIYYLPRFVDSQHSDFILLVNGLKKWPARYMPIKELITREYLPSNRKRARRILAAAVEEGLVTLHTKIPISQCYANEEQFVTEETEIRAVELLVHQEEKLRTMLGLTSNEQEELNNGDDGSDIEEDRPEKDNCRLALNRSVICQVYDFIRKSGRYGVLPIDIQRAFHLNRYASRHFIKKLCQNKLIEIKREQSGRQQVFRYKCVNVEVNDQTDTFLNNNQESTGNEGKTYCSDASNVAISKATENILDLTDKNKLLESRKAIILKTLDKNKYITRNKLFRIIHDFEKSRGHNFTMCRKTLKRIIEQMEQEGLCQIMKIGSIFFYALPNMKEDEIDMTTTSKEEKSVTSPLDDMQKIVVEANAEWLNYWTKVKRVKGASTSNVTKYKRAPKFLRLSILHDYLFYLTRDYTGITNQSKEELLEKLANSTQFVQNIGDMPPLYSDHITNYMFVPPLPRIYESIPGWCTMATLMLNIPLTLFVKIVQLQVITEEIEAFLEHPIRMHYPLKCLPVMSRSLLMKEVSKLRNELYRLAFLGLIQFGPHGSNKVHLRLIYTNVRASVLDTTTSPKRPLRVDSSTTYSEKLFEFKCKADVKLYWVHLFNVCLNTKLTKGQKSTDRFELKDELRKCLDAKSLQQVIIDDTGELPGDRLGAGGLDSSLFSFIQNHWVPVNKQLTKSRNRNFSKTSLAQIRRRKKKKPLNVSLDNDEKPKKKVKKIYYDALDLEALKLMTKLRVGWSFKEDQFLLLCKAALTFLCPGIRTYYKVSPTVIRSLLWTHVPIARNKTQRAIGRRLVQLCKHNKNQAIINGLVQVLKLTREVRENFDTSLLLPQIKPSAPNVHELSQILNNMFTDLINYMVKRFLKDGKIVCAHQSQDSLPDSIDELNKIYSLKNPAPGPLTISTIRENSVQAIIMSSIACSSERTSLTTQLFHVYNQFEECLLRCVVNFLHDNRIISSIKKNNLDSLDKGDSDIDVNRLSLRNSPYHFAQRFYFFMLNKYKQSVFHMTNEEFEEYNEEEKDEIELNLTAPCPFLTSLVAQDLVDLTLKTADEYLSFDSERLPKEKTDKIMQRYAELMLLQDRSDRRIVCGGSIMDSSQVEHLIQEKKGLDDDTEQAGPSAKKIKLEDTPNLETFRSPRFALFALREIAEEPMESSRCRMTVQEMLVLNPSKIYCNFQKPLTQIYPDSSKMYKKLLSDLSEHCYWDLKGQKSLDKVLENVEDVEVASKMRQLMDRINELRPYGLPLKDITHLRNDEKMVEALNALCALKLVRRLGVDDTVFVSNQLMELWTIESLKVNRSVREKMPPENFKANPSNNNLKEMSQDLMKKSEVLSQSTSKIRLVMRPWIRIEGTLNRKVLDRFLGAVLGHVMLNPGILLSTVIKRFDPGLTAIWVKELVEVLVKLKCIEVCVIKKETCSLFSSDTTDLLDKPTGLELNHEIILEPTVDAIFRLGRFIGYSKLYNKDFLVY